MCVLVGVPTVLIDTQTRIILLATNNTKTAVAGAIGMALIEISLRSGKAALVMWEIRRHNVAIGRKTEYVLQGRAILEVFKHQASKNVLPSATTAPRPSMSTRQNDFEMWRRQVHTFHTAEVNADMYAEYISIGCAASISFFYGNHPHYPLLRQATTTYTGIAKSDNVSWRVNQLKMLSFQIGVEVIVDYISTVMEIAIGIELDQVKNLGSFLGALFMVTAVMNITISIGFYLS
ncbi:hypothetical protein ON010_g5720 [Phytophthora cinnamomi]|nr:hypothetical protein ON010_g5720 [Phytophthora cinnamomi]